MDEYVKNKLTQWNLAGLKTIFEEEEIDEEAFRCLTTDAIKRLIPKTGPQMKFLKFYNVDNDFVFINTSDDPMTGLEIGKPNDIPVLIKKSSPIVQSVQAETVLEPKEVTELPINTTPVLKLPGAKCGLECGSERNKSDLHDAVNSKVVNIRAILERSVEGKVILNTYVRSSGARLSDKHQILLAKTIVSFEIQNSEDYLISSERLRQLADSITVAFPKERAPTYYVPFKYNKVTKLRVLAKGKLYDQYCKYRSLLRETGAIITNRKSSSASRTPERPVILGFRGNLLPVGEGESEDINEQLQWLQNCIQPWPTVEQYWKSTSQSRINQLISSSEISSTQYFFMYKSLCQPLGYNLLNIDFTSIYPEKTLLLFSQWPDFVEELLCYSRESSNTSKDTKKLVAEIDEFRNAAQNEEVHTGISDVVTLMTLRLLPLLLPCPSIKVSKKPAWRPTKSESQKGFFLLVPSASHLETALRSRKEKLATYGLTEQPLPVAVGESVTRLDSWYVCINDLRYKVHSPLEAVDIVFKSFFELQLQYPKESETSWMVLQERIYNIKGEVDKISPNVVTLLANLQR